MKRYYMHTIDGKPAYYSPANKQIVFTHMRTRPTDAKSLGFHPLAHSLKQIRDEQRKTRLYRQRCNFGTAFEYGYCVVHVV